MQRIQAAGSLGSADRQVQNLIAQIENGNGVLGPQADLFAGRMRCQQFLRNRKDANLRRNFDRICPGAGAIGGLRSSAAWLVAFPRTALASAWLRNVCTTARPAKSDVQSGPPSRCEPSMPVLAPCTTSAQVEVLCRKSAQWLAQVQVACRKSAQRLAQVQVACRKSAQRLVRAEVACGKSAQRFVQVQGHAARPTQRWLNAPPQSRSAATRCRHGLHCSNIRTTRCAACEQAAGRT